MKRETAVKYLTMKVAKIFYDTVECSLPDRAESDWLEAERLVPIYLNGFIGRMTGDPVAGDICAHQYRNWNLPDDCSYEQFEEKLGEYVWKNSQHMRYHLSRPPYGKITFD
jgi:hypothetical protein